MTALFQAADAQRANSSARPLIPSPPTFDGMLEELTERFILPNLPSATSVTAFHATLVDYVGQPDALFLLRAVRGTERRQVYVTGDGTRFKATDNAPAWWVHAALLQGHTIAAEDCARVMATIPAHLFDVAKTSGPTANAAGWHIAHLFNVKDGWTDFEHWDRLEVIRRFIRNVHPCNYFLLPKTDWQRWGSDAHVLGYFGALYAERYADVWPAFLALAQASIETLPNIAGPIAYAYGNGHAAPQQPRPPGAQERVTSLATHDMVEYRASRLTFKRDVIEGLADGQILRIITPIGTFAMTKADVYGVFPKLVQSRSYREAGTYNYRKLPRAIEPFRVAEDR